MNISALYQTNLNSRLSLLIAVDVVQTLNVGMSLAYRLMQSGELSPIRLDRAVLENPKDLKQFMAEKLGADQESSK